MNIFQIILALAVLLVLAYFIILHFIEAIREIIRCTISEKLEPIRKQYLAELRAKDTEIAELKWRLSHPSLEITIIESKGEPDEKTTE